VQDALAIDRAEASKLVAVARAIPADVCEAIGKAPKIGRGRWQEFAEALKSPGALQRVNLALRDPAMKSRTSDDRFSALLSEALPAKIAPAVKALIARDGSTLATIKETRKGTTLHFDAEQMGEFGTYLRDQIPELFEAYKAQKANKH